MKHRPKLSDKTVIFRVCGKTFESEFFLSEILYFGNGTEKDIKFPPFFATHKNSRDFFADAQAAFDFKRHYLIKCRHKPSLYLTC